MLLWSFIFPLIMLALEELADNYYMFGTEYCGIPWGVIDSMTTTYQYIVEKGDLSFATFWQKSGCIFWVVAWIVLGAAAAVGSYLTFGKRRMEKTEEISDSFLGFRTLIPAYAVTGMLGFAETSSIIFWVIIELLALVGYTIYRRGFHYKRSDIIILASMIVFIFFGYLG